MPDVMDNVTDISTLEQETIGKRSIADHVDWTGPIPKCFDWRDWHEPVVTKVKEQGRCDSCGVFAAVAQMESVWAIQGHNPLVEMSTQQVVSCDNWSRGCNWGWSYRAMMYVLRAGGLQTESSYPYGSGSDGVTRNCNFNASAVHARFSGWLKIGKSRVPADNEYDMMMYLYRHGPIVVSINAQNLRFYSNRILSFCGGNHKWTTHIVVLTGFGVSDSGTPFWIVRNSYGDDWGDGGYFLIERNVNMCGIGQWAYAAYITPS
ncbi:cysteine proteinase B-like [Corticium candelabrum]|uniref:cysteine proteinase B-like n=1 Tax=Corticium candelabrum TaxID=121492 RepID=UPI002E259230|nr:cysteine proteinase B-like [Corticium candelabrum]